MKTIRLTALAAGDFTTFQRIAVDWDGEWWLATVKKVHKNGDCDIVYDTGDKDTYSREYMSSKDVVKMPTGVTKSNDPLTAQQVKRLAKQVPQQPAAKPENEFTDLDEGWCIVRQQYQTPDYGFMGPFASKGEAENNMEAAKKKLQDMGMGTFAKLTISYGKIDKHHKPPYFSRTTPK